MSTTDSYERVAAKRRRRRRACSADALIGLAEADGSGPELVPGATSQRRWRAAAPPHLDRAPVSGEKGAMRSDSSNSKSRRRRRRKNPGDPTASLPDEILFNILSRLPVKSLFRCKAVSQRWRSLISHEDYSRKFRQTLPCLLCYDYTRRPFHWHALNVWEGPTPNRPLVSPSLSFLPARCTILDCCNGMILYRFSESNSRDAFRYAVCNPVEMTMILLPDSGCGANKWEAALAFDPAFYPEFHVLEFVMNFEDDPDHNPDMDDEYVVGANIYSSVTGAWNSKESDWSRRVSVRNGYSRTFFKGFLYLHACEATGVMAVDVKGEKWRSIPYPNGGKFPEFVGIYKEQLCYVSYGLYTNVLSFWILEDHTKDVWTMKHQVSSDLLCEKKLIGHYKSCVLIGILPDCNFILYITGVAGSGTLMAYDMDHEETHAIQKLEECSGPSYFLYVPFYTG